MDSVRSNMIAIILSGGQSSRMGQDKGLIHQDGISWAETLLQKLEQTGLEVYISINTQQESSYAKVFDTSSLLLDHPSSSHINGPLKGILSAHLSFPNKHILFLPCDMPLLDTDTFEWWMNNFISEEKAIVCSTPDHLQPLCGIYSQASLKTLQEYYDQKKLQDQSMHSIIKDILKAKIISIPEQLLPQFKNFNTPDDLQDA